MRGGSIDSFYKMDSILQDVLFIIENWLEELDTKERQFTRIATLQESIEKRCLEERYKGNPDSNQLQFVSQCWKDILTLLTGLPDTKSDLIYTTLQQCHANEISVNSTYEKMIKAMS